MLGSSTAVGVTVQLQFGIKISQSGITQLPVPPTPDQKRNVPSYSAGLRNPCWDHGLPQEGLCCERCVIHWVHLPFPLLSRALPCPTGPSASLHFGKQSSFTNCQMLCFAHTQKPHPSLKRPCECGPAPSGGFGSSHSTVRT